MAKLATRPRLTADDYLTLAWVRDNMGSLRAMVEYHEHEIDPEYSGRDLEETPPQVITRVENLDTTLSQPDPRHWPGYIVGVDPGAPEGDRSAYLCSVCLTEIPDIDLPCPACVEADRLAATPQSGHGADIAELQRARERAPVNLQELGAPSAESLAEDLHTKGKAHPLDVPGATPPIERVTSAPVPRVSNAINRAPLPTPPPPARAYSATETCNACGRLGELHMDKGGPIGHVFEPQP